MVPANATHPVKKLIGAARSLVVRTGSGAPALLPAAIPFQNDLEIIAQERPPRFMRSTLYVLVSLFVALIVIASVVKVDMVVVAQGELATDTPTVVLQPLDRSIIRDLKVKEGDVVTKGEVLATLDPTFTQADVASLTAQQRTLVAQISRAEAELKGAPYDVGNSLDPDELLQATLYRDRQQQYTSRLKSFDEEISQDQASIRTTQDDRDALVKQVEIAKDLEKMRSELMATQSGSKLNYLDAVSNRLRTEQEYQTAVNHLTELTHSLQAKQADRQTFIDEWHRDLLEELVKLRTQTTNIDESLTKATRINDLVVVTAPQDGVVLDIANRSVGSVLQGGEPLITIVPSGAALIANISINSADVGYTTPGNDVAVKVDAFPYQRHGLLRGRLRSIGEESFTPGAQKQSTGASLGSVGGTSLGGAYHRGQVELTKTDLQNLPKGAHLIPGMTLTAEIEVGRRRIISYFLYPLIRGFSEAIREP